MGTLTCRQLLESLDAYIDGELSDTARAAVETHRRECASCSRTVESALDMRAAIKDTVAETTVPPRLRGRIEASLTPQWLRPFRTEIGGLRTSTWVAAAGIAAALVLTTVSRPPLDARTANAMDRVALRLDDSSAVELTGVVLCRDCELERRYGVKASCRQIGHHGAIFTADGRILNIVEQRSSADLIHNHDLLGKQVVVRGRLFRGARALVVDSFQISEG